MRPCKACGAALPNNCETCPECGGDMSLQPAGPPPQTGPGVSGGPEERQVMIRLLAPPVVIGLVGGSLAVAQWGPWGILAGLLAGLVAFAVCAILYVMF